jgi:hypothetical protein
MRAVRRKGGYVAVVLLFSNKPAPTRNVGVGGVGSVETE